MARRPDAETVAALELRLKGLPDRHSYFAQVLSYTFQDLNIGAALQDEAWEWHAINSTEGVAAFEYAHARGIDRATYNGGCLARARQEQRPIRGEHAGVSDFFVPFVDAAGRVDTVLVTGTFTTGRPTAAEMRARWRWITGKQGRPEDAEFSRYLALTLDSLTLEGERLACFERWLECFAALVAGRGDARALATEAARLKLRLDEARSVDRMWRSVREMLDESRRRVWNSPQMGDDLLRIGVQSLPEHALVGLLARPGAETDPVEQLIERDAFQRTCVELAQQSGCLAGRIGEHGVVFLLATTAKARLERELSELSRRAVVLARDRFGLRLHIGMANPHHSQHLGDRYEQALGAAELALSKGLVSARAEPNVRRALTPLRALRFELRAAARERPAALTSRFERYVSAVANHANFRVDVARAELDAGFEQAAQALMVSVDLPESQYRDACRALDISARDAANASELFAVYRRSVAALVAFAERPVESSQVSGLGGAHSFIADHLGEPLTLARVARVAGFAPSYFSALFKRLEGETFERYVRRVRIERAKELLAQKKLPVARVAELTGFRLRHYFYRVFKEIVGVTPKAYQNRHMVSHRKPVENPKRRARVRR